MKLLLWKRNLMNGWIDDRRRTLTTYLFSLAHLGLWGVFHVVHRVASLRTGLVSHGGGRDAESEKQGQSWSKSSAAT